MRKLRIVLIVTGWSWAEWRPPSEKESGVRLRTAMMRVGRWGLEGSRGGRCGERWRNVRRGGEEGGRAER